MFKELYNLSKLPNFHNKLKVKLDSIQSELTQSMNSPIQDPIVEVE